jgi:hypothetical protein
MSSQVNWTQYQELKDHVKRLDVKCLYLSDEIKELMVRLELLEKKKDKIEASNRDTDKTKKV